LPAAASSGCSSAQYEGKQGLSSPRGSSSPRGNDELERVCSAFFRLFTSIT
jgi:hypothetical protein